MAFYRNGSHLSDPMPEEEDMEYYSDLLCQQDNEEKANDNWEATMLAFGCRSRPLPKVSDYKIPLVGNHASGFSTETKGKRVGKGRSRLSDKPKVDRVRLGINQEFEMYDSAPVSDFTLPIVRPNGSSQSDRPNANKSDPGNANKDLSVRPKSKAPSLPDREPMPVPELSLGDHSTTMTNGHVATTHIVPLQNKYRHEQFLDCEDELSTQYRQITVDEDFSSTCNFSEGELSHSRDEPKSSASPSKMPTGSPLKSVNWNGSQDSGSALLECDDTCSTLTYKSAFSRPEAKSSTSSMRAKKEVETEAGIGSTCARSSQAEIPQLADDSSTDRLSMDNLIVHDWWDGSENKPTNAQSNRMSNDENTFEPIPANRRLSAAESSDVSSSFGGSTCQCISPDVEGIDRGIQADLGSETLLSKTPPLKSKSTKATSKPNKIHKMKLTTYNHVLESQDKEHLPIQQPAVRPRPYGWGDTWRAAPAPHTALFEPRRTSASNTRYSFGICPTVSAHGNADDWRNCSLNALLKPTPRSAPIFFEEDFPSLSTTREDGRQETPSPEIISVEDAYVPGGLSDVQAVSGIPENAVPKVPTSTLNDFDCNTVVIENVPPNAESILKDVLTPFNIKKVSFFYTGHQHVAYVRLDDEENCKWLIDCLDDMIPGGELSTPLKLKKLN